MEFFSKKVIGKFGSENVTVRIFRRPTPKPKVRSPPMPTTPDYLLAAFLRCAFRLRLISEI